MYTENINMNIQTNLQERFGLNMCYVKKQEYILYVVIPSSLSIILYT